MAPVGAAAIRPPKQRCSQPMPFDPEELSQKLNKVIADRQAYSERRRRARAEGAAGGNAAPMNLSSSATQPPPHASMAREIFEQGTLKPGERRTVINPVRPRTEPAAKKPTAPKERPDTSAARPKSKMSDDSRSSSSKSKDSSKSKHHYIPQFAASQFARTTTSDSMPEGKGLVHKLSRTALRIAQAHRERHQQERKNFYSDRIPEDETQPIERPHRDRNHHRHTIEGAPAGHHAEDRRARAARRASTGAADLLMSWGSGTSSPNPDGDSPEVPDQDPYDRRADWTQRDEAPPHQPEQQAQRQKSRPSLRSADSIWALRNKLSALTKHKQDDQQQRSRDGSPPSDTTLRSPKSGFFSRFKVNH
ncbi:hypothetical protein N0V92_006081 [Colletotrichum tropicale]|nr:hypothetical protein N0V92_006081 [Colletotrichum tropicale]